LLIVQEKKGARELTTEECQHYLHVEAYSGD
jgi:hypothetical protein